MLVEGDLHFNLFSMINLDNFCSAAVNAHIVDAGFSEDNFELVSGVLKFAIARLGP